MDSRRKRLAYLGLAAVGVVFGVVLETAVDPYEGTGIAALGLFVGIPVAGVVAGYLFKRKTQGLSAPDERFEEIEMRASRVSHGVLTAGVAVLALALVSLPWVEWPVTPALWVLLVGSIAVHELSIEHYRRQM